MSFIKLSKERSFGSVFFWVKLFQLGGAGLIGLAWLVPNHYRPWPSFHSEMVAFLGLTLLVMGQAVFSSSTPLVIPTAALFVLGLMSVPWIQYAAGITHYAGDTVVVSLYLVGLGASLIVGFNYCRIKIHQPQFLVSLMVVISAAALVSGAIGLVQWLALSEELAFFITEGALGDRAMGNLAQSNHLSTLLLFGLLASSYVYEKGLIRTSVLALSTAFLSLIVVLTQSRTATLGVIAIAFFLLMKRKSYASRLRGTWVVGWVLLYLATTQLLPLISEALLVGGDRGVAFTDSSGRWLLWKQFIHGVLQSPWVGFGWNQSVEAQMLGGLLYPGDLTSDYAHNVFIDLLAWNGVPLGFTLIGLFSYWFISRSILSKGVDAIFAMAFIVPLLVHSLLEYPFAYGYFLLPAGIMAGIVEVNLKKRSLTYIDQRVLVPLLGCWIVLGCYFVYEYFLIEEDFRVVRFENMRIGKTPDDYDVPKIWISSHMAAMLKATRTPAIPKMNPEELDNLKQVTARFAYGALTYRYALALGLNGHPEEASRQMALIRGIYGKNYYLLTKEELRLEANGRYPQLKAVKAP